MTQHTLEKLVEIIRILRSPDGCPWDREQTHESVKQCIIEETYEFLEAIDENNPQKMREELGDIIAMIVFHAQLAEEDHSFTIYDVIGTTVEKLIRRHPHVFGDKTLHNSEQVLKQWDQIKKTEENHRHRESILDGVPKQMPSLMRAQKIQKKAAKVGFDWENPEQIIDKIQEELDETREALLLNDTHKIKEEIGDLFFTVTNLARYLKFNCEELSQRSVDKFIKRFQKVEQDVAKAGKELDKCSLSELDALWNKHKLSE